MRSWSLNQQTKFLGREVRYDTAGSGQPIVLVHGTPWSSFNLRHLINGLSGNYSVHFFDLLGYGQSSMDEGDVSLGIQNELLNYLLDLWQLDDPIIIGHDFGGATALRTLLINQRRFSKLVLIDPVALAPWGSPFFRHVQQHQVALAGLPGYIHAAVVRAYVQSAAHSRLADSIWQTIVEPWIGEAGQAGFYRQIAQADQHYTDEIERLYAGIDLPTLILWGSEDHWIPVRQGERLQAMIPGSQLIIINNAGHLVIEEQPAALIREIRAFIEQTF